MASDMANAGTSNAPLATLSKAAGLAKPGNLTLHPRRHLPPAVKSQHHFAFAFRRAGAAHPRAFFPQ